ncbi:MAG: methylated-DNA--[protein]-cysteine S-methyltransferase [Vicinamibacterales bacterium]
MIEMAVVATPIGPLTVAARDGLTCLLHFGGDEDTARAALVKWYGHVTIQPASDPGGTATVLRRYFAGELDSLDDVEVEMNGTDFQRRVWAALRSVKAGRTASYAQIAHSIAAPSAVRAVGAANGANPVAVVVPCHRIIGTNGTLTGYGGGLERKEWLLRHEGGRLF